MQPVPLTSCRSASSLQKKLLPAPAGRDDDLVGVVERPVERIEQHRRLARARHAGQHAAFHRQRRSDEGHGRGQRAGVQIAGHEQAVLSLRQATEEALLLFPERAARMRQQRVELLLRLGV